MKMLSPLRIGFLLSASLCAAFASPSRAQTYPDRPIRLVVPFSAGSNNDVIARLVADHMSQTLKQSIVIDNRVGAGGIVGATAVARAEPDGYTVLFANTTTMSIQPVLANPPPYDVAKTFLPISTIGRTPLILVVSAKSDVRTVKDLIEHIRKKENANYATAGNGTPMHLVGASFGLTNNLNILPIPYRGSPEMTTAVLSGDVMFVFDGPTDVPFIKDGSLRGLAVTGFNRMKDLPDVPTMAELGYSSSEYMVSWYGLVVPAGTPKSIVDVLNAATRKAVESKEVKEKLDVFGAETFAGTPEDMRAFMTKASETWTGIISGAGLKP
jgi:tripartite-type tricarboxylate transporter receptor subunit TctC